MTTQSGALLLQAVAERIIARHLERVGYSGVMVVSASPGIVGEHVDLIYKSSGRAVKAKVKPDAYFGTDQAKVHDRSRPFYRPDVGYYAFEAVSNSVTREPGWMFASEADELHYYYLVLDHAEDEVQALLSEPDPVFFSELKVERDELRILPMRATREWFESHFEDYTPRPVSVGERTAWFRLIPRADIDDAVAGIKHVGAIFADLAV